MLSFRLQCPKCKLKCVTYPDEIVYMITENHNPRLMFGEQVLESDVESVRVHCYFCKFEWGLGKEDTKVFIAGIKNKSARESREALEFSIPDEHAQEVNLNLNLNSLELESK